MLVRILLAITLPVWAIPFLCWMIADMVVSDYEQSR